MLVRDSVPRLRVFTSRYVCPTCLSRGYATRLPSPTFPTSSSYTKKWQVDRFVPQRRRLFIHRTFATTRTNRATGAALASTTSPLDNSLFSPSGLGLESPEDVRAYLKKWSRDHQKSIRDNAPDRVQIERHTALPNSLFLRNNSDAAQDTATGLNDGMEVAEAAEGPPSSMDDVDDFGVTRQAELKPGDAIRITGSMIARSQLAIFVGSRGVQALYFLADGRWYATTQHLFNSHVVSGFATSSELSQLEVHLPRRTIEYQKAEDGQSVPFTAVGDIPHTDSRHLLKKLADLNEEVDKAKRDYPAILDQLYNDFADESEFKYESLKSLLRDRLDIDMNTLTDGARIHLFECLWTDPRLIGLLINHNPRLGFVPKKMTRSMVQVTQWARSYQDAAARAAIGKNVSEELTKNPLIPFISKARRLISKSRKIRLPTLERELGPTIEEKRPPSGTVERIPTGEEFTEDEKKIIEFLWLVYVKRPSSHNVGGRRNLAIASLIIRAVGAYPKFTLDPPTGVLFLKELGCLDPWALASDYFVTIAHTQIGLHQPARLAKEKTLAATAALEMQPDQEHLPFSDTMAHLRHDWGDLEVFCIDAKSTKVVDDAISVEPSQEFPDHHWVRVHIAHLSAFVPHNSPLLAQAELMGCTQYSTSGNEPCIPFDAVKPCSLGPNKPVLTISTLLTPEGSIKDINITPGIIRNVIKIDSKMVNGLYNTGFAENFLTVGTVKSADSQVSELDSKYEQKQLQLVERHRTSLDLLQTVLMSRWEARYRENPEHLQMLKLPVCKQYVKIFPFEAIQEPKYERLFRSEHVVGDLSVSVRCEVADYDRVSYREQNIKCNPVAGAMMLASEAAAMWTAARGVPVIYRYTEQRANSPLSKLNSLGPHDFYIGLGTGESVEISRNLALSMPGYMAVTSPLRKHRDLINHHQIDAYLRAQAGQSEELDGRREDIEYPRSRQQLIEVIEAGSEGHLFAKYAQIQASQWTIGTLYRAFYFQASRLPQVWDVYINNPVSLGGGEDRDVARVSKGTIAALGIQMVLEPSEQGWEKMAKFRQFLPCKLIKVSAAMGKIHGVAIGPPSDEPHVKDLTYPEMRGE